MNQPRLTRNQQLVYQALRAHTAPQSAYELLAQLRTAGLRAPLQIYRALDKLQQFGLAHRLESLNAFIACQHKDCPHNGIKAFAICEQCQQVQELSDPTTCAALTVWSQQHQFMPHDATVELRGRCRQCHNQTHNS